MIKLKESSYDYKGYSIINDNSAGIWKITDPHGKPVSGDFATDVEAQEFIDSTMSESVITESKDDEYFDGCLSEILDSAMLLAKEADAASASRYKYIAKKIIDVIENL